MIIKKKNKKIKKNFSLQVLVTEDEGKWLIK